MNWKVGTMVTVFTFAMMLMATQAFATKMGSKSGGDAWTLIRPDVTEEYAYSQQAPCLVYCSAEDAARVYSYYGEGHSFSFSEITSKIAIPKPTMKGPAGSERSDIPEMNHGGDVPTWY